MSLLETVIRMTGLKRKHSLSHSDDDAGHHGAGSTPVLNRNSPPPPPPRPQKRLKETIRPAGRKSSIARKREEKLRNAFASSKRSAGQSTPRKISKPPTTQFPSLNSNFDFRFPFTPRVSSTDDAATRIDEVPDHLSASVIPPSELAVSEAVMHAVDKPGNSSDLFQSDSSPPSIHHTSNDRLSLDVVDSDFVNAMLVEHSESGLHTSHGSTSGMAGQHGDGNEVSSNGTLTPCPADVAMQDGVGFRDNTQDIVVADFPDVLVTNVPAVHVSSFTGDDAESYYEASGGNGDNGDHFTSTLWDGGVPMAKDLDSESSDQSEDSRVDMDELLTEISADRLTGRNHEASGVNVTDFNPRRMAEVVTDEDEDDVKTDHRDFADEESARGSSDRESAARDELDQEDGAAEHNLRSASPYVDAGFQWVQDDLIDEDSAPVLNVDDYGHSFIPSDPVFNGAEMADSEDDSQPQPTGRFRCSSQDDLRVDEENDAMSGIEAEDAPTARSTRPRRHGGGSQRRKSRRSYYQSDAEDSEGEMFHFSSISSGSTTSSSSSRSVDGKAHSNSKLPKSTPKFTKFTPRSGKKASERPNGSNAGSTSIPHRSEKTTRDGSKSSAHPTVNNGSAGNTNEASMEDEGSKMETENQHMLVREIESLLEEIDEESPAYQRFRRLLDSNALPGSSLLLMVSMHVDSLHHDDCEPKRGQQRTRQQRENKGHAIKHRSDFQNELAKAVRATVKSLLQPIGKALQSVTPREVQDFVNGRGDGPSKEDFRLDFRSTGTWVPWNKAAADIFVDYFVNLEQYEDWDRDDVKKAFKTYLKQLKNKFNQPPSNSRGKVAKEVNARRVGRRRRTFGRCMKVLEACSTQYKSMKQLYMDATKHITMDVMSGEETCDEGMAITRLPWRSRELGDFLHRCSDLHLATKYNQNRHYKNGAFPYCRIPSRNVDRREQAPQGLPANFYDQTWLNDLNHPNRKASLKMKPAIDLTLPNDLLNLARRFEHVHSRTDMPLPTGAV
ncbi:hypothetical protein VKT23_014666 [Stygiomarasmius scandens]|uniref:Uncharacterized protein n=1 Tax=Marasmiellus scandens TaxID=2682957 RepID=A0ABR1J1A0_9AGAR